ncbi:flagellar FliJ family protein [uncultured Microbacterium sp.]|uniref:flagellar FliJ family protein n=1 Tax=uncultured Microbacterium sp. TaxID=191216 RepID=UPI0028D29B48|nr:flagellar FliJ family protein [uncultured Microbacterium sp.]
MTFPLAGLLRVRGAQERVAAERLSRATAERMQSESAAQDAQASLADLSSHVNDAATLLAMAAARAAGRSALSDLQALTELHRAEEDEAKYAHVEAKQELKGLERLESTHRVEAARAELSAEQNRLDEIAVARVGRGTAGAA